MEASEFCYSIDWAGPASAQERETRRGGEFRGCPRAGTEARWPWSSPPGRLAGTRTWAAPQRPSSSTAASARAARWGSPGGTASCSLAPPAPAPHGCSCLQTKDMRKVRKCTRGSWTDQYDSSVETRYFDLDINSHLIAFLLLTAVHNKTDNSNDNIVTAVC